MYFIDVSCLNVTSKHSQLICSTYTINLHSVATTKTEIKYLCCGSGGCGPRAVGGCGSALGIATTISLDWFVLKRARNVVQEIGTQQT